MTRYLSGGGYSANFMKKRVLPIYVINVLLVVIYCVQKMLLLDGVEIGNVLRTITFGGNVVDNGWYLQVILLFYIVFYFATKLTPKRVSLFCSTIVVIFVVVMIALKMPVHWYVSSLAYPCGILWSRYKTMIDGFIETHYRAVSTTALIAFFVSYAMLFLRPFEGGIYTLIMFSFSMTYGLLFTIVVLILMMQVQLSGKALTYCSDCYLEIYVLQGLVFTTLKNNYWTVSNPYLFAFASLILTVVVAKLARPLFLRINTMTLVSR